MNTTHRGFSHMFLTIAVVGATTAVFGGSVVSASCFNDGTQKCCAMVLAQPTLTRNCPLANPSPSWPCPDQVLENVEVASATKVQAGKDGWKQVKNLTTKNCRYNLRTCGTVAPDCITIATNATFACQPTEPDKLPQYKCP